MSQGPSEYLPQNRHLGPLTGGQGLKAFEGDGDNWTGSGGEGVVIKESVCAELGASATKVLNFCFCFHSFYRKRPR